jgi:hypothetical protein
VAVLLAPLQIGSSIPRHNPTRSNSEDLRNSAKGIPVDRFFLYHQVFAMKSDIQYIKQPIFLLSSSD